MTPHIIFHLGPQKTGTTSIQTLLDHNRAALKPKVESLIHPRQTRDLFRAVDAWLSSPSQRKRATVEQALRDAVQATNPQCQTLIVSEEMLVSRRLFTDKTNFIKKCARLLPLLAEIVGPSNCTFVAYLREYDGWIESAYRQDVKELSETRTHSEWMAALPIDREWPSVLQSELDPDINLVFIEMSKDARHPPLGRELLKLAGMTDEDIDGLARVQKQNERLPDGAVAFMREINRLGLGPRLERRIRRVVRNTQNAFTDSHEL